MDNIIRYFGRSFEIPYIEKGSYVPVGGSWFSDELDTKVLVEGDGLESLVQEMKDTASRGDRTKLKAWLESGNLDVDENLFATLYAFTSVYNNQVGFKPDSAKRREMYSNGFPRLNLSEIITGNAAECAEIAALAQLYLQEEGGAGSTYFSGEILWNKKHEYADAHSFIPLKFNSQEYVFDPANPHRASSTRDGAEMLLPRIQKVENFRDKISQGKKAYIETSSVLDQSLAWYGVGDGTNVSERDFV